jgi:hypothetical protein
MLITRYFLFIHLPKTGGQFVREVCDRYLPAEWRVPNDIPPHAPYREVKDRFPDLPILCFVRNPWDWYVSWFHYIRETPPLESHPAAAMWETAFELGKSDFAETVRRACTGEGFGNPNTAGVMRERGIDHYSAIYWQMAGDGVEEGRVEVGRSEDLVGDLVGFLERHDVPLSPEFEEKVRNHPRVGTGKRAQDYRSYYDDELRELVADKARGLIQAYGYSF